jgi:hypothetical protein
LALVGFVFLLFVVYQYSSRKGTDYSGLENNRNVSGASEQANSNILPAQPAGQNENYLPVSESNNQNKFAQAGLNKPIVNPEDLLPRDENSQWAQLNPRGSGELNNVNLLSAGYLAGINTVGSSLRNANLQLRSEPPNPQVQVSPWMNTTIEPDLMRVPLELGTVGGQQ